MHEELMVDLLNRLFSHTDSKATDDRVIGRGFRKWEFNESFEGDTVSYLIF